MAFQQQYSAGEVFTDLGRMLDKAKPDAVHILLPAAHHAAPAEMCLAGGAHIFVEKPFCATSEECLQVKRTAGRYGRHIGVNHNLTYMPGVLETIDWVREWKLGGIEHITVQYNVPNPGLARGLLPNHWMFSGTDRMMLELGPHPLSVVYRFVGKVKECRSTASGEMRLANGAPFFDTWQSSLNCERGTAQVLLSMGKAYPSTWIHVLGQDGDAFIDLWRYTVRFTERSRFVRAANLFDGLRIARSLVSQSVANFRQYSLAALGVRPPFSWQEISIASSVNAFYQALAAGKTPPVGAEEGTAVVQACEEIVKSALLQPAEMEEGVTRG